MHGTTIDRRVKKTKKQLRLALMHLMTQKSAKSISVRELAEQADINRSTLTCCCIWRMRWRSVCQSSVGGTIPRTP